jgi:hypothetical protein
LPPDDFGGDEVNRVPILAISAAILVVGGAPASATVDRFDDVTTQPDAAITDGYAGFNWHNFWVLDATTYVSNPSGYLNGQISSDYVAFNAWGAPAEFSGGPFHFVGAYLTSAWRDGLNVDIEGYRLGTLAYSQTLILNTSDPLWFAADYLNVDTVRFVSYGGTHHRGYPGDGTQFALDNLTYTTIPAPGALVLLGLGTGLTGWLRRRQIV